MIPRFLAACLLLAALSPARATDKPNILLMVADDLGYGDLGCYGATRIKTPRIDSLARDGSRFTDAHSYSGICMPSRYAILSGRYAFRIGRSMEYACNFDPGQVLLPMVLKSAGYRTAMLGKWHNGFGTRATVDWNSELKPGPLEFGFDSFFGTPRTHSEPPLVFVQDHRIVGWDKNDPIRVDKSPGTGAHGKQIGGKKAMELRPDDELDLIAAAEAEKYLARQKAGEPFFLYLAWQAPHNPLNPVKAFRGTSAAGVYGDYVQQLDHCVGQVLDALEKHDLAENTLVLFTSDNGGRFERQALLAGHRPNGGLLGQKTDVWEGGHRVPLLARWPGRIPAGGERTEFFHQVDLMATLAEAGEATVPEGASPDGRSELAALLDPKSPPKRTAAILHGTKGLALRQGPWLYISQPGSGGKTVPEPQKPWSLSYTAMGFRNSEVDKEGQIKPGAAREQLYDLGSDLAQTTNLADRQPERLAELRERFVTLTQAKKVGDLEEPLHDIVVYGDSSGAVTAAIDAKRRGLSVILVNPTAFPGGMSASGLGATDFLGRRNTFGGIASEFYDGVAAAYGTDFVRSFEPHVGRRVFEKMIADAGVKVVYNELLDRGPGKGVKMNGKRIESITTLSGKTYRGKMFIDATYVGDLMAAAGVSYTVGREPESHYGESLAGVRRGDTQPRVHYTQRDKDHFIKRVDPYVVPGDPKSGLLPYVFKIDGLANGQGDKKIQAYNYRVCLTSDPELRIPIEKPPGYREIDHELLLRNFDAGDPRLPALIEPLAGTGSKVDWNNMHAVGSDHPGANWDYPEASYEKRREIEKKHENYIRGFLWTLAHHPRVPEEIRKKAAAFGLPRDEFTDNGGWPWMIYIREARRMVSDYVMNQHDCEGKRDAPDPVALGSFGMDSHAVQHFVTESGHANTDGVIWRVPPKPYGISYRSIIPKKGECENLFAPVCLSTSHVAHGSIRMEPVFMALSQSAAIAAELAIADEVAVQDVAYPVLREKLEAAKQIVRVR